MGIATAPSDPPVTGRVDREGRLIAADPRLEALQRDAGGAVGTSLAIPQIAAIARLAADLGTAVTRSAIAADRSSDYELSVQATPDGSGVSLVLDNWTERPASSPRFAMLMGETMPEDLIEPTALSWSVDSELRFTSLSDLLASEFGIEADAAIGQPLTRFLKLEEDENGELPLLAAAASRHAFSGQPARVRGLDAPPFKLDGDIVLGPTGDFAGFQGRVVADDGRGAGGARISFDEILDEALRNPLDRIIEQADRIVAQSDGPLQADYAAYGNDIAAAARHLLSVVRSMHAGAGQATGSVDMANLAEEAVIMLEAAAEERRVSIQLEASRRLPASGDERAVIQILVNLIGNAIRHSPVGSRVTLRFSRTDNMACVSVEDQGSGIAAKDQERIFERFERATDDQSGTGLGLAISRRLARSMGGDVSLDPDASTGARFKLTLPIA
jgi:signal transduction histidine kinase